MDQAVARRTLQELIKREDLDNKKCIDCANPNPQWASLSFAVFLCLQCAGVHRGFGVHVSFVRSVSMDTWQEEQVKRMQIGGNAPFREFMRSYNPQTSGWKEGISPYDTYHSWAASQYKEKLDAALAGRDFSPSAPPEGFGSPSSPTSPPNRPSSAQGLRKARASARSSTGRSLRSDSASPASFSNSPLPSPSPGGASTPGSYADQKGQNEAFFATLGQANASRPADLPPSQGGRYQGFGNTPTPPPGSSSHPSFALSSANAPSLTDLQENPVAALSKGWSLLSAAVAGASRAVAENVIQPGVEKVLDPTFQATVKGYAAEAGKRAGEVGRTANLWTKTTLGVDVADSVHGVVGTARDRLGGGPQSRGYGALGMDHEEESSALYHDDEDEFFDSFDNTSAQQGPAIPSKSNGAQASTTIHRTAAKKTDDWDDWKDF
ncbi:ArfGap-domain-containing protein [Dichomitus squalens LYAD-421 SS1]|uniref:ArfGap-domain-containing protein n=1 Tax=Dichomitus squalens (strain LYAD-421) TaxID=732165 RepID=R7T1X8_DICSQ|nr:ArfGap-domain-containing protein [Dichomitus squalens LYAD-421 SS1]EJF62386.1 ArfGap-domain-containing protein [Dichomitus squalens LYAD-421 SS1]